MAFGNMHSAIYGLKRFCQMHAHIDHDLRGYFKNENRTYIAIYIVSKEIYLRLLLIKQ